MFATLTPGERESAGIPLHPGGAHETVVPDCGETVNPAMRYEFEGHLIDGALHVESCRAASDQSRPDLRGPGSHFRWDLTAEERPWPDLVESAKRGPLDESAVMSWSVTAATTTLGGASSRERRILGIVFVVRWMTADLRSWMVTSAPRDAFGIVPIVANSEADLLP